MKLRGRVWRRLVNPSADRAHSPQDSDSMAPLMLEHIERCGVIRCPLILISQISRSGGTWLSQLFDHHPQIWAHPHELKIGYPRKWDWPDLAGVKSSSDAWHVLRDAKIHERFGQGRYSKGTDETHLMLFSAALQGALFLGLGERLRPASDREWLDVYFTSFFYAWLDYQRRYGEKRYVTAFASMLALQPASMSLFKEAYPDGWLISVVREPVGWYGSVKRRSATSEKHVGTVKQHYAGPQEAEAAYLENVRAIQANRALFGDRFLLLDYDTLVSSKDVAMRSLADRIGLVWHVSLTQQTFNGMPIGPNTSFRGDRDDERTSILSTEERSWIGRGPMVAAYLSVRPGP